MNIKKAHWYSNDGDITLSMPFQKVNKEARTVSGFATLDNVDRHDDIVTPEASLAAFQTFRGNLREMHQPIAVGKVISFAPETIYDPITDKYYNGVYVEARVSKGANDTWEKVLDGTLSGFSIGGKVLDAELVWNDDFNKNIQLIKSMELYELSLVDNPANPLANVVSIQKVSGGNSAAPTAERVFTCQTCKSVVASPVDAKECPECESPMTDIGWIERAEAVHKEIKKMVSDFYKSSDENSENNPLPETTDEKTSEGAINMAENEHVEEPVAEESEVAEPEAVVEEVADEVTEEVAEPVAEEDDASDAGEAVAGAESVENSMFESIVSTLADLKATLEGIAETAAAEKAEVAKATAEVSKTLEAKIEAVEAKLAETVERLEKSFDTVEKQIEAVADATAVKKSGDLGGEPAEVKKSLWNGHFLGINSLEN